jgi:hypothetical protein
MNEYRQGSENEEAVIGRSRLRRWQTALMSLPPNGELK